MRDSPPTRSNDESPDVVISSVTSIGISSIFLIAANLIPLIGAIFWDWKVADVVILYWIENVIVGIINAFRMAAIPNGENPGFVILEKCFTIGFFLVHYGIFTVVHGVFVFSLLGDGAGINGIEDLFRGHMKWAILALLTSHLISFFLNFLGRKEYTEKVLKDQMFAPYPRMVALHIAILFGAFAIEALGQPLFLLIILVVGKIIVDLKLHIRSHRQNQVVGESDS